MPLGSFWLPLGALWSHLAVLWARFGPFASLWDALGLPLAILWAHLAGLWSRFGTLWESVGRLGPLPSNFKLNVHRLRCLCIKSSLLEHAAGAAGTGEVVSRTAARSPPPTRAGGQDDGSYTNSLKLV